MSTKVVYGNYPETADTLIGVLEDLFVDDAKKGEAIISVAGFVQSRLQEAHNDLADGAGFVRGLTEVGIEIGFIANAFLLAPLETAVRLAVMPIFLLAAAVFCCDDGDNLSAIALYLALVPPCIAALQIPQGAVSAFYSHPVFLNKQVSNHGQACYHLFREAKIQPLE